MDIKELKTNAGKKNHPWEYARCKVICNILKNFISDNEERKMVFDIGSGDGFFITQFSKNFSGFELVAVDTAYDDALISDLREKYTSFPIDFFKNISEINDKEEKVKAVFLLDVLEHIEKDIDFLKELSAHPNVDRETLFVISVPAYNSLFSTHDEWLGHYRRYSQKELNSCVKTAGLTPLKGGYFFTSLLVSRFVQNSFELVRKRKISEVKGIGNWEGGRFTSFIYEKMLLMDYSFFKIFNHMGIRVPGLSTYILCKKSS